MVDFEIETVGDIDTDATSAWFCRGHVSKENFLRAVEKQYKVTGYTVDEVQHVFARIVPYHNKAYDHAVLFYVKPGRGAFAVTVLEA